MSFSYNLGKNPKSILGETYGVIPEGISAVITESNCIRISAGMRR